MFEGKSIFDIINMGGATMYVLILCSVVSLTIILERIFHFREKSKLSQISFMMAVREALAAKDAKQAIALCETERVPIANVARAGLTAEGDEKAVMNAMNRQIAVEVNLLERFVNIVGTLGGTVVYVGLFGTVIGIIRAFHEISLTATTGGGMTMVISGIAEALICTATGIAVAVPSVIAYNLLSKRIEDMKLSMELTASEVNDLIRVHGHGHQKHH